MSLEAKNAVARLQAFQRFVGVDENHAELLHTLRDHVGDGLHECIDRFYVRIMAEPTTARVFTDQAQLERAKASMVLWMREMLTGPWGDAYIEARVAIGRVHVEVKVSHEAMHAGMCYVREYLYRRAAELPNALETSLAVSRATEFDLATMVLAYHEIRSARAADDVRNLILSHLPTAVILLDAQRRVVAATPSVSNQFGVAALPGMALSEVIPESLVHASELVAHFEHAAAGSAVVIPGISCEVRGKIRHFSLTLTPVDARREVVLLHIEDHTLTVATESRLRRAEALAHVGVLSAQIAHELRNPLAGISGALQILRRDFGEDPHYAPVFDMVLKRLESLDVLVVDLLNYARPRDPNIIADCDLNDVCRSAIGLLVHEHPQVAISISGSGTAAVDPDLCTQVIANLVINAVEAQHGRGRVRIVVEPGGVRVEDDGPGVDGADHDDLFEPFRTTKARGTGLGLAICRRYVELMNGTIELIDTDQLGGAAFRIRFDDNG